MLQIKRTKAGTEAQHFELPNGSAIFHVNKSETEFIYDEIFKREIYLKHGITLHAEACIFDVGANIGLFTLFLGQKYRNAKIYAFEPIPPVFGLLELNIAVYHLNVKAYRCGLAEESGQSIFTFYPNDTIISSSLTTPEEARDLVKGFLRYRQGSGRDFTSSDRDIDAILEERLESEKYVCRMRTISEIIDENGIEEIDLLKIDVEKGEHAVLKGIKECDWLKVRQLVIEVHDVDNRLEEVIRMLERRGYQVSYEQDASLGYTTLYNVYAVRPSINHQEMVSEESETLATAKGTWNSQESLLRDLRSHLTLALPDYMVPAAYVCLESLPLTPNGKLDRKVLPAPEGDAYMVRGYEAPVGEMETKLAAIWAEVLKLDKIGRHDNFFELGGHSLLVVRVVSRVRHTLGLEVAVGDLFASPELAALAHTLENAAHTELPPITRAKRNEQPLPNAPLILTATGSDGHKIASRDKGGTWFDLQTGKVI